MSWITALAAITLAVEVSAFAPVRRAAVGGDGTQTGAGVTNSYLWGADLLGGLDSAGGVGGLLAVTRQATGDTSLPIFNGNGDVMGLLDAQSGASVAQYEFGPFGETLRATGPRAAANPFRFSTKYADHENGLLYYGFRLYSPPTGRWMSEDPLGIEGGLNLLGFSGNDPIDNVDPLGLDWRWEFTGNSTWETVRAFRSSQGWGKGEILRPQFAWNWHPESNIQAIDSLLRELAPKGTLEASGMAYLHRGIDAGLRDCAKRYGDSMEALADPGKLAAEFAAALRSDPQGVILGMLLGDLTGLWGDLNKIVDASGAKLHLYQSGYALGNRGPEAAAAIITGGLFSKGRAAKGGTEVVQRAMSRAELEYLKKNGTLRFGKAGTELDPTFVSDAVNSDLTRARLRLSLPKTPEVRVTLEVEQGVFSAPSKVNPLDLGNGRILPGGGTERTATGVIKARVLGVDEF